MITFSITLSLNQIACLRSIQEREESPKSVAFSRISHFITGVQALQREGLVTHHMPETPEQKKDEGFVYWRITAKGRLLLQVIELDVRDAARALSGAATPQSLAGGAA